MTKAPFRGPSATYKFTNLALSSVAPLLKAALEHAAGAGPATLPQRLGGHAIGAVLVRWRRARQPQRCSCCRCRIAGGEVVFDVDLDGDVMIVCSRCAGRP